MGVLDERLDTALVEEVARPLPDWEFRLVGPVADAKFDPAMLPRRPTSPTSGSRTYEDLPAVLAGFDVALMPFALNEATRSISPTKTLEYLAAGLPVVSTPVPDVVADFGGVVHSRPSPASSSPRALAALAEPLENRDRKLRRIERRYQWDDIAGRIHAIMQDVLSASAPASPARSSTRGDGVTGQPRIVVIGAGPTGLGAGYRLAELGYDDWVILEATIASAASPPRSPTRTGSPGTSAAT